MQELGSLVQRVRIFINVIGMKFRISMFAMLEIKRGKLVQSEGIELQNGEMNKPLKMNI